VGASVSVSASAVPPPIRGWSPASNAPGSLLAYRCCSMNLVTLEKRWVRHCPPLIPWSLPG